MTRNKLILIIISIVIFFSALGVYFTIGDNSTNTQTQNNTTSVDFDFVREDVSQRDSSQYFSALGANRQRIVVYGGSSDIRTFTQGQTKYGLIRNPKSVGGLEFIASNSFGEFYLAKDEDGNRIEFSNGSPDGRYGLNDFGEVSGVFIGSRIPSAEYYAAYPIQNLAIKSGFEPLGDTGQVNRYLNSKFLKITNLNNNRSVIAEIDTRNYIEDTLFVSEAVRRSLMIDNNALGSFKLEIVDKENNTLGFVGL
jgi:hypothetical protein